MTSLSFSFWVDRFWFEWSHWVTGGGFLLVSGIDSWCVSPTPGGPLCAAVFWIFYKASRQRKRYVSFTVKSLLCCFFSLFPCSVKMPYNSEKHPNCHNCNLCIIDTTIFCLLVFYLCFTNSTKRCKVTSSLIVHFFFTNFICTFVFLLCKFSEHYENGRNCPGGYNPFQGLCPYHKVNRLITIFGIWTANFFKKIFP